MKIILQYPFFVFLFRIDEDLKIVTMTKHIARMNSMKQNSILLKGRFNHHESDQHLNDLANTHGYNSRMWHNVSPARHRPKYSYFTFATLQNAKIRVQEPIIKLL